MDYKYISFAHEQDELVWDNVLSARFGVVQGLNVLVSATQSGLFNVSISDGLWREEEYLRMLIKKVLPFLTKNKDMIYVQETNEFTTSEIVRNWFSAHPKIKCVTWPPMCGITPPMSLPWTNMKSYVKENVSLSRRRLVVNFWDSLKENPDHFKNEHIDFVRDHSELDWNKTLFARFGEVRCINVLVATTQFAPFEFSISDGPMSEKRYLEVLNDIILPLMAKNKGAIYVQESNEITKSSNVTSWFQMHLEIRFITWPPIISPISQAWENMNKFVDDSFPLTGYEIRQLISDFFKTMKVENPRYQIDSFNRIKSCFTNFMQKVSSD